MSDAIHSGICIAISDLLEADGQLIGYITNSIIFHQLGLTTIPCDTIEIATTPELVKPRLRRAHLAISFVPQRNLITRDNIRLLRLLDAIRYYKKIPETPEIQVFELLKDNIARLPHEDRKELTALARKYPASTRMILAMILTTVSESRLSEKIRMTLNPRLSYNIPLSMSTSGSKY